MSRLFLVSTVGNDVRLLESWLSYYSEFDFDGILLSLQVRNEEDAHLVPHVEHLARRFGAEVGDYWYSPGHEQPLRIERLKSKFCGPDDWIALADLDEFVEFTEAPKALLALCKSQNVDYVTGHFLDRLGAGGTLPALEETVTRPLWDQFPLGCHLTRDVARATDSKVVLASSQSSIKPGSHQATGRPLPIRSGSAIVHHFKWDKDAVRRTRYMLWVHAMQGRPWVVERLRILRYLERMQEHHESERRGFTLPAFWPRYRRTIPVGQTTGEPFDSGIDIPYVVLSQITPPTGSIGQQMLDSDHGVDAPELARTLYASLDGTANIAQLTDDIFAKQRPDGQCYPALEPLVQHVARCLVAGGHAEMVKR